MATGSLVKIDEEIVSSAVASVTLTGIDSTYDVYMVRLNNVLPDTDATSLFSRVTIGGTADTTANYDRASKGLRSNTTFSDFSATNDNEFDLGGFGTAGNESANGEELKELRKENLRFWKDVMLEDISAIEGMQEGRNSPVYNGGNFSPVMDQPTHQFHKWVANSLI